MVKRSKKNSDKSFISKKQHNDTKYDTGNESDNESETNNLSDDSYQYSSDNYEYVDDFLKYDMTNDEYLEMLKNINWYDNADADEIKRLEPIYDKVCREIIRTPKLIDVLRLNIPDKERLYLIQEILVLDEYSPNSPEFIVMKEEIMSKIEHYSNIKIKQDDIAKYEAIEKSLEYNHETPLKYRILDSNLNHKNKSIVFSRFKKSQESQNEERGKLIEWVENALLLPTKTKDIEYNLEDIKAVLDKSVYGLDKVKEQILMVLNNRLTNKKTKGFNMALCGAPGTSKTSIINCLGRAIDLPVVQISLGGAKDSSFLLGHGYTYIGSNPGAIVRALQELKYSNGIIYFDEFDKIESTLVGSEISRALLHITDFTQNYAFHDNYFENIDIDLSNIWFIYSMNSTINTDRTLLDRVSIIYINPYTYQEKKQIVIKYLLPEALRNVGLKSGDLLLTDDGFEQLHKYADNINRKNNDTGGGVRQLKHLIESVVMKINLTRNMRPITFSANIKIPMYINKEIIENLNISDDVWVSTYHI